LTEVLLPEVAAANADLPDAAEGLTATSMSPRKMAYKRYLRHKGALVCTFILAFLVLVVLFAPLTMRYGVNEPVFPISEGPNQYLPPQQVAWFGTDDIGRDLYSRLIAGLRVSLVIGLAAAIFSTIIGVTVGSVAGLRGGLFDDIVMRVTDIFLAFPFLVALLVVRAFLGGIPFLESIIGKTTSIRFVIVLFVLFGWMGVARLVRGQVLALKEREFIEASRALGASNTRVVVRHLLPNSVGPILVALTFSVVAAVLAESTLGFFGFGPQPGSGSTSLGILVGSSKTNVLTGNWWMVLFPCLVLLVLALTINMLGDGLRDATDPKLQRHS
jgi:peptide/nickel transport system permease protein